MVANLSGLVIEGIEEDQRVIVECGLVDIGIQGSKHGAVLHIVAVHGDIVAGSEDVALLPGIDTAAAAVGAIVVPVEVVVGIVRGGLHHRVIQLGALNAQPAHKIIVFVLVIEALIVHVQGEGLLRRGLIGIWDEFRSLTGIRRLGRGGGGGLSCGSRHVVAQLVVGILGFLSLPEVAEQIDGAAQQRHCQNGDNGYVDAFFHGYTSRFRQDRYA